MKKILGISLCALFAVSAANAEIASKAYVDGLVGGIDTNAIATNTSNISALTTRVSTNETAITALDGRVDAHDTSITNLTTSVNDHNTRITNNANAITALQGSVDGLGALASKDIVATADIDDNAVTSAKIANNTITDANVATNAQIASSKIAFNPTQTAVFGSGITQEHVNKIDANASAISTNAGNIAQNATNIGNNAAGIEANETAINSLTGRVTANEGAITALQGSTEGLAALAYKDTVATADIDANAVTSAQIANQTITNDDVATDAAIEIRKIAFTADQTAALNSTINSTKVAQITANGNEIGRLGDILKPSEQCLDRNNSDGCTLVIRNGDFSWEAVTRAEGE